MSHKKTQNILFEGPGRKIYGLRFFDKISTSVLQLAQKKTERKRFPNKGIFFFANGTTGTIYGSTFSCTQVITPSLVLP